MNVRAEEGEGCRFAAACLTPFRELDAYKRTVTINSYNLHEQLFIYSVSLFVSMKEEFYPHTTPN